MTLLTWGSQYQNGRTASVLAKLSTCVSENSKQDGPEQCMHHQHTHNHRQTPTLRYRLRTLSRSENWTQSTCSAFATFWTSTRKTKFQTLHFCLVPASRVCAPFLYTVDCVGLDTSGKWTKLHSLWRNLQTAGDLLAAHNSVLGVSANVTCPP